MSFLKNKWFWILMVVAVGGYWWYSKRNADQELFVTTTVGRGDVSQVVSASATLLADQEIDLDFEIAGRMRTIVTKVGAQVGQGDALAIMESAALDEAVRKAQAALEKTQADAGVNDDELREAREKLKDDKNFLEVTEDAEDRKVDAADKAFDNAEDYESDAQNYYDQVVAEDGIGSATAKSAKLILTKAINDRKSAEEAKATARSNRDVAVRTAQNAFNQQKERVKTLESKHQDTIENSAIAIARADYEIALDNLEKVRLTAPVNGTITRLNFQKGEVVGSATTDSFGRLLSSDLILEARVPESDIAAVKVGQTATVTFDALGPDELFEASVIEVDPESTVVQDVVSYKVKLRLANIDQRLKPGMSGDVDVHIAEKKATLLLPPRAVKRDGGVRYIEVKSVDGKTAVRKDVKVGLEGSEGQIEILSGVSEGDEVIVEKK